MRSSLIALMVIVFMCLASISLAEEAQAPVKEKQGPVMLTDDQLDEVVGAGLANAWGSEKYTTEYIDYTYGYGYRTTYVGADDKFTARPTNDTWNKTRSVMGRNAVFDD
jgi:hypothetical protein